MPSSPKIPKEVILECALKMLIREGYAVLNIKALAKEIGCSTQPISWHFGTMEGLRKTLAEYALQYANEKIMSDVMSMEGFESVGIAYINMAFDEPNLFCYLYMSDDSGILRGSFDVSATSDESVPMIEQLAIQLKTSKEKAGAFYRNMIIYTHGLASYIASGRMKATKEEAGAMMRQASEGFLWQIRDDNAGR